MPDLADSTIAFSEDTIAAALTNIYHKRFNLQTELEEHIWSATRAIFQEAITQGLEDAAMQDIPLPEDDFIRAIRHNADVFAAFRTHRTQNDIADQMIDENGKLKSFRQFEKDVQPYVAHRNRAWLRTEYDTAIQRAHIAAQWQQFEREKDVLPNLEWIPSTSPNPSADHRVFWGTVLPLNDPFWNEHRPGDRWNCKCELRATDKGVTTAPTHIAPTDKPAAGLGTNPGKKGELFDKQHPYFAQSCSACPFASNKLFALFSDLTSRRNCSACKGINKAMDRAELKQINVHTNRDAFIQAKIEAAEELKAQEAIKLEGKRYYSKRLYFGKKEIHAVIAHCYNALEIEAAKQLPKVLKSLRNGKYEPVNMSRKNYKQKMQRDGIRNFVRYEVRINGEIFELKCTAKLHTGRIIEHPYSLKQKEN